MTNLTSTCSLCSIVILISQIYNNKNYYADIEHYKICHACTNQLIKDLSLVLRENEERDDTYVMSTTVMSTAVATVGR